MAKDLVEIKSEFDAEFRRFSVKRSTDMSFLDFQHMVEQLHNLKDMSFVVFYTDPVGDLLPITNNDNFKKALATTTTLVRLTVQRKDENWSDLIGYSTLNRKKEKNGQSKILAQLPLAHHSPNKPNKSNKSTPLKIGMPEDFRQVSAIIDVDKVPQHHRRVRLLKHGSDRPLGFYIHSRPNLQVTPTGLAKVPAFFISRLVAGGLAESTGLISVNDEIVEVNGIEVANKTLDQVSDMMIANCSNLILTIKPANQRTEKCSWENSVSIRSTNQRMSQMSVASTSSGTSELTSHHCHPPDDDDMDEVRHFTTKSGSSHSESDRTSSSSTSPPRVESGGKRKRPITNGQVATKNLVDGVVTSGRADADQLFTL